MATRTKEGERLLRALILLTAASAVLCQVETISQKEGTDVELKCPYPSSMVNPRVEWKFTFGTDTSLVYYDGELTGPYKERANVYPQGLLLKSVTRKDSGEYTCEASTKDSAGNPLIKVYPTELVVLVPPSVPVTQVPKATTGGVATLFCVENDASPRPTFSWFKNNIPMPQDPKSIPSFQNTSYTLDPNTGQLRFDPVMKTDSGEYYCQAKNSQGTQVSQPVLFEVNDVNTGGIVAAVIISLLILGLIAFAVWFAYHRGYIGKKANKKVIYSQASETRSDKNFQQTSSFLV